MSKNRGNLTKKKLNRIDKLLKLTLSKELVSALRQENEITDINIEKTR